MPGLRTSRHRLRPLGARRGALVGEDAKEAGGALEGLLQIREKGIG